VYPISLRLIDSLFSPQATENYYLHIHYRDVTRHPRETIMQLGKDGLALIDYT
jgi:hypothetical protein